MRISQKILSILLILSSKIISGKSMVYAPMIAGAATIAYEGALDYPTPGTLWEEDEASVEEARKAMLDLKAEIL